MSFFKLFTKRGQKEYVEDLVALSQKKGKWRDIWARMRRNKLGMLGLCIIVLLILLVAGADIFTKYTYFDQNPSIKFTLPSNEHIMGTDNFGRDLWARMLYGGRVSLLVAFFATCISVGFGTVLGAVSGFFGGKIDLIISRILDVLMAVPGMLLAIAIAFALGSNPVNTALAISVSGIPLSSRLMRSTVMAIKENEFVEAARATGSKSLRIVFIHVLPNTIAPLIVNASMWIAGNIMAISGLSFIGLGVTPPTPEWGQILMAGKPYFRDFWPMITFPSLFIMLTLFGFNLLGDGLRDALDPRLKD
jgi:peptide/nickel transport system permease protein